jgi:hypothetical protein
MLGGQKTIASRRSFAPAAYAQDDTGGELAETKKSYPTRKSTFSFWGVQDSQVRRALQRPDMNSYRSTTGKPLFCSEMRV